MISDMSVLIFLLKGRILSKIALIGFLLTLPLSVRKVFLVLSPDGSGVFNEYTDISLYLSDLTLLVFFILILLENKNKFLSIIFLKRLFHVEQLPKSASGFLNVPRGTIGTVIDWFVKNCSTWNIFHILIAVPIPFLLWTVLSIFWSESKTLAFYATIKLFEGYFLYVGLVLANVPRGTILISSLKNIKCSTWNNSNIQSEEYKMFHVEHLTRKINQSSLLQIVPRGTFRTIIDQLVIKCSTWNNFDLIFKTLILSGFFQALLAIWQFIGQSSIGMTFFKESQFSAQQAGIAKILLGEDLFIRSYALFPHPNVLGAFLGVTVLLTIGYQLVFDKKMFHVEQLAKPVSELSNVPRGTIGTIINWFLKKCSTWNIFRTSIKTTKMFHVEHSQFLYAGLLGIQLFGFLLTFSKSALFSLFLAITYMGYKMFHVEQFPKPTPELSNVPRGTILGALVSSLRKCSTWNIFRLGFIAAILVLAGYQLNWHYFLAQPFQERIYLNKAFFTIFHQWPWQGTGIGQSVFVMQDFFLEKLNVWQFQPIHNLYLLTTAELGLVGVILFLVFILILVNVPRGTFGVIPNKFLRKCSTWNNSDVISQGEPMFHVEHSEDAIKKSNKARIVFQSVLIFILITGLFDHYYWDIQQGHLLLWLVLGLMASYRVFHDIDK